MILKRELAKEKNDEMKYSHFLCTLERANQEKLKMAIVQLKCVPCLNKFTTNFNLLNSSQQQQQQQQQQMQQQQQSQSQQLNNSQNSKNMVSHANMSRLLKQMSLIVSTELQQIAIDLIERMDEDKPVKFIRLKDEFKHTINQQLQHQQKQQQQQQQSMLSSSSSVNSLSQSALNTNSILAKQQQQQLNNLVKLKNLTALFAKKVELNADNHNNTNANQTSSVVNKPTTTTNNKLPQIFNPHSNLQQFMTHEQKSQTDLASFAPSMDSRTTANSLIYPDRF